MPALSTLLVIFGTLTLSSFAVFWSRALRIPHTVLLVAFGVGIGILSTLPEFVFLNAFHLTPEVLFYIFLPTLIFESAYNIRIRQLAQNSISISLLAVASLLVSTFIIGYALTYLLSLFSIDLPLSISLLFGALISATDPVAVLALFKEFGAPRRLSLIFEGESLFNDATAVALFLVLLDVVLHGFEGSVTILEGFMMFVFMIVSGVLFGTLCGVVFAKCVEYTRANEFASITLTVVLAYTTFLGSEFLSRYLLIGGHEFHISSIIATTIASLVMGNYGRPKIHPRAEEFVDKLWGQLAFMANSVIFILVGVLFVDIPLANHDILIPIVISVFVVATARALSIYPIVGFFNTYASSHTRIPRAWQHLLSWGSLRGALAVTLVLLIPQDLAIPEWSLSISPRDFILALTVGCIFFTIFVKATTIQAFMRFLKLDRMTPLEEVQYAEARALTHHEVVQRLEGFAGRGYISPKTKESLSGRHTAEREKIGSTLSHTEKKNDFRNMQVLRIYAIGIERRALHELYRYNEIAEITYKRISEKLTVQLEDIERGNLSHPVLPSPQDVFSRALTRVRELLMPKSPEERTTEQYAYYRAQAIISRKVLKELTGLQSSAVETIFDTRALAHTIEVYTIFRQGSQAKMDEIEKAHPQLTEKLGEQFAACAIAKVEEHMIERLYARDFITPKLFITLKEDLEIS